MSFYPQDSRPAIPCAPGTYRRVGDGTFQRQEDADGPNAPYRTGRELRKEGRRSMRKLRMALGLCVKCGGSRPTWAAKCNACAGRQTWTNDAVRPPPAGVWVTDDQHRTRRFIPDPVPPPRTDADWLGLRPLSPFRTIGMRDGLRVVAPVDPTAGAVHAEPGDRCLLYVNGVPTPFRVERATLNGHPFTLAPESIVNMSTAPLTATRYKAGDRVLIARNTATSAGAECVGKLGVVERVHDGWYSVRLNGAGASTGWCWYDCELDPAGPPVQTCFWLVWREPSTAAMYDRCEPTRRHPSYAEADAEAKRLAAKHPGARFHVLRSVEHVEVVVPAPAVTVHAEPEGIPEGPQG